MKWVKERKGGVYQKEVTPFFIHSIHHYPTQNEEDQPLSHLSLSLSFFYIISKTFETLGIFVDRKRICKFFWTHNRKWYDVSHESLFRCTISPIRNWRYEIIISWLTELVAPIAMATSPDLLSELQYGFLLIPELMNPFDRLMKRSTKRNRRRLEKKRRKGKTEHSNGRKSRENTTKWMRL